MRLMCVVALLLAGCGVHNYEGTTKLPQGSTTVEQDTGPFNSNGIVTKSDTSDYDDCLAKFAHYPDRESYCKDWIAGGRPGQPAREYFYGGIYR